MKIKRFKFTPWMAWIGGLAILVAAGVAAGLMVFWKAQGKAADHSAALCSVP